MKNLIFCNDSDVHLSREFVKDIISKTNFNNYKYSLTDSSVIKDINIECIPFETFLINEPMKMLKDNIFINTYSNYDVFQMIYNVLGVTIEKEFFYIPSIDYNYAEKEKVKNFFENKKYVLISNKDINNLTTILISSYPDIVFVLIDKTEILIAPNVYYIDDIVKNDFITFSYFSTKCDLIVGNLENFYFVKENIDKIIDKKTKILNERIGLL